MAITSLNLDNASAEYAEDSKIAFIKYSGVLTAEESTAVYNWLADLVETVGLTDIYGEVFDFREVTEFAPDNLMEARRNSRRYNMRNRVHDLPVAMIISSFFQEEILRGPMQNVEENKRKAIVWEMEDAINFLDNWHAQQETSES
ncbi:MAG: hypothetical protein Phog2KO_30390 [Phototrophicaceae bacterium]